MFYIQVVLILLMTNKFAFSAVAGVTTIVVFTIILAGVIFVHVESIRENQENINYIQGIIKSIYTDFSILVDNNKIDIWNVTIRNNDEMNLDVTYHIIFNIKIQWIKSKVCWWAMPWVTPSVRHMNLFIVKVSNTPAYYTRRLYTETNGKAFVHQY